MSTDTTTDIHVQPAGRRSAEGSGSPFPFLALGLAGVAILLSAQIYYFMKLDDITAELTGPGRILSVIFGCSFLIFTFISATRYSIMMAFAYLGWSKSKTFQKLQPKVWPKVSILVPAYNEAPRIERSLQSMLELDYPSLEIVVVDDGSSDDTFKIASQFTGTHGGIHIRVLRKANGGKSSALNLAFRESSGDFVLCVDADSHLDTAAARKLIRPFANPRIGAVAGQVRVRNRQNLITRLQALEYTLMNGMPRFAQSHFNSVLISPGPISMFRRSVLNQVAERWGRRRREADRSPGYVEGPWENDTFAEDADLTLNVLMTHHGIVYEPEAISFTAAPTWTFSLLNQRYRWLRGNVQAINKVWHRWRDTPGSPAGLPIWMGVFLVEQAVWPFVNIFGLIMFAALLASVGTAGPVLYWFAYLLLIDLNAAAFSVRVERESKSLLLFSPLFRMLYNVILDVNTLIALTDEFRGKRMTWS
ncbi:MAG: glycosyltransferase family 2 protein [Gemmatimonadota bacterium]|jgi:cellulose synthase/poly-beta-1,6-N-acetylglucosamine synthase-like glycosyltransferase|nr:glycosyltransferase family 2 protein [Gemmatimonadota bacterium]MDP6528654.1 glycosyltransferase family 2 protein [Gemmatimonadota bacterium]MDP6803061.1 glycosyltransferase family 2 protein [Gemmatimonadota bacterium]MDP7032020.1 glycosyltransferase family 2 protein [Gemmatimonadota bacterium]